MSATDYLAIVYIGALAFLAMCIGAAIVEAIGPSRLGRLLGLDVRDSDE